MKPFRFNLAGILEARIAQEAEAGRELAIALEKQREAMARSQESVRALNALLWTITTESANTFSVAHRERSAAMRQVMEKTCAELRVAAEECIRLTDEKRAELLEARKKRAALARLKEARYAEWEKEAERAEQHLFDEFAMTRRFQAAQLEYAVC